MSDTLAALTQKHEALWKQYADHIHHGGPAPSYLDLYELTDKLAALAQRVEEERDMRDRALQALTPGGSEYVNDPPRCVEYVRQRSHNQHEITKSFKRERDEAEAQLADARAALVRCADCGWTVAEHEVECVPSGRGDGSCEAVHTISQRTATVPCKSRHPRPAFRPPPTPGGDAT